MLFGNGYSIHCASQARFAHSEIHFEGIFRGAQVGSKIEAGRMAGKSLLGGDFDGQMLIFREMPPGHPASPGK